VIGTPLRAFLAGSDVLCMDDGDLRLGPSGGAT
jgi:hypothetical protein